MKRTTPLSHAAIVAAATQIDARAARLAGVVRQQVRAVRDWEVHSLARKTATLDRLSSLQENTVSLAGYLDDLREALLACPCRNLGDPMLEASGDMEGRSMLAARSF